MSRPLSAPDAKAVTQRLTEVRRRIALAGADPLTVTVLPVTKGFDRSAVDAALSAGLEAVGENYANELLGKALPGLPAPQWHYIGSIQRRTLRALAPHVRCWQSVWRDVEGEAIARHAPGATVMVEVNLAGSPRRPGVELSEAPALVRRLRLLGLDVVGLMAVAPPGSPDTARQGFRAVADAAGALGLPQVSMGMSGDFEVAVQEGSTMVRIGTALFGPRPLSPS